MTPQLLRAFENCKKSLTQATLLAHPDPAAELAIVTDAFETAIGTLLQQQKGKDWEPLAFYSHKLSNTQRKYSPYDRELLAVYEASLQYSPNISLLSSRSQRAKTNALQDSSDTLTTLFSLRQT
ncbi:unnamed protein product [Parnassius mnemosyne]|uniref:Reverse transcriptase/retrotransposon-derived protein RNase H-like domain-containing protein n=1 Tax=Parnassius mnemosyne TaxID=213953 RepID=A0AAV1L3F2_9NEOP